MNRAQYSADYCVCACARFRC